MKSIIGAAVAALVTVADPVGAATADDFQVWSSLNLATDFSKKWVGAVEVSTRLTDNASQVGLAVFRPTIGYRVNDDLVVHLGYARQATINRGTPNVDENRFFQQTNWRIGEIAGATVNSRTRIELRTIEGARDTGWRVRQRLQAQVPLKAAETSLILSSEHAFALNSTDWGARAGFDQMRNFIGVSLPLSMAFRLETGFQHRYQRRDGQPDRSDFVLPLTLSVRL